MTYPSYTVWFRGKLACPCLAQWLPVYEAELQRRGTLVGPLRIYQLIGSASASADTHKDGGAFDITDLIGDTDVWVARQMGADATWARTVPPFTTAHLHGVLTGCPHNGPARYQIDEVRAGGDGLLGNAPDPGPRPLSGRTWREGIAWAKQLQEDTMNAAQEQKLDNLATAVKTISSDVKSLRKVEAQRHKKTIIEMRQQGKTADEILAALEADA